MTNISSLVPSSVNNTLSTVVSPTAFGNQIQDKAKQKLKQASLGKIEELKQKGEAIVQKQIELEKTHATNLQNLKNQYQPKAPGTPTLTEEEYNTATTAENLRYQTEKESLKKQKDNNDNQTQSVTKDPKIDYIKNKATFKSKTQAKKAKSKAEKVGTPVGSPSIASEQQGRNQQQQKNS